MNLNSTLKPKNEFKKTRLPVLSKFKSETRNSFLDW